MTLKSFNLENEWKEDCKARPPIAGFNIPRKLWMAINRVRTNHGRCASALYKWGKYHLSATAVRIAKLFATSPVRSYPGPLSGLLNVIYL